MPTLTLTPAIDETGDTSINPKSNVPERYLTMVLPPLRIITDTSSANFDIVLPVKFHGISRN
jgi:hypothetical protein